MIQTFLKNTLAISDGIMASTKGWRGEGISKKSFKAEEKVFGKKVGIWAVMKSV